MKGSAIVISVLIISVLALSPASAAVGIGGDQGYFAISSNPSGATVYFDGQYRGTTPVTVPVSATGTPSHTVSLSLQGYQPWMRTYNENPPAGETITVSANLVFTPVTRPVTPLPGAGKGYYVISSSPLGANVYFDGSYRGLSPATIEVSSTGTPGHSVRLSLSGYQDWTTSLAGNPSDGQTIPVTAYLTPASSYGSISVTSSPSGATAVLDGGYTEITPCTFSSVSAGQHNIRVNKQGYSSWTADVSVAAGMNTDVSAKLEPVTPATGTIYAVSLPQGAGVTVDGISYGPAPQLASGLSPGYHQVRLSLSGFQDWSGQVLVTAGSTTTVSQTLSVGPTARPTTGPGTGLLSVVSLPAGAQVYVDDLFIGVTPLTTPPVTAGSHQVLVRLSGYADWLTSVQVSTGQTVAVEAVLSPVSPTPTEGGPGPGLAILTLGILAFAVSKRKR